MTLAVLPTTVVGSYVQPGWLVDRENLKSRLPPRVRASEVWKVPRIVGKIRRSRPIEVRDAELLVQSTTRRTKITLPGPFTMLQQAQNDHYPTAEAAAMDYAAAVNEEIHDLFRAGVDMVQLDEPYLQARPEEARKYAVKAITRALADVKGTTAVHLCFGYAHIVHERPSGYSFLPELEAVPARVISIEAAQPNLDVSVLAALPTKTIMLGVISMGDPEVESPEIVAARIRRALTVVPAARLMIAPDCGMKYLSRQCAFGKLEAMVRGTKLVREELRAAPRS